MLILSRKVDETITISDSITVRVLSISEGHVKLGIDAPREISVYRSEIYDMIQQLNKEASRAARSAAVSVAKKIGTPRPDGTTPVSAKNVIQ